jgi:starch phosphorylase
MNVPCIGYGIRYEYGIFRQTFVDGRQVEQPDTWLSSARRGSSRTPRRPCRSNFGGHTETFTDEDGTSSGALGPLWNVLGVPYNYMVPGYLNGRVNTLRLWSAQATKAFDLQIFNSGDYAQAVRAQTFAENISKVLYPEDSTPQGRELRLQQQYFFVACSLHDFIEQRAGGGLRPAQPARADHLPAQRHPPGDRGPRADAPARRRAKGWTGTRRGPSPEVLRLHLPHPAARGPGGVADRAARPPAAAPPGDHLPINEEFLAQVREAVPRRRDARPPHVDHRRSTRAGVRMAYLATVAATKVNGVAELHSQLLRDKVLPDFSEILARQVHQRHQRRHPAPLRQAGQPEAVDG